MIKKYRKSLANLLMYPLYTLFCIKIKKFFLFFLNPGTIGTIKKSVVNRDRKYVRTFASYEEGDELFSDRNVFPVGCVVKMEKVTL
jgi:hypothetical protein